MDDISAGQRAGKESTAALKRGFVFLVSGKAVAMAGAILLSPLLTRIYSPEAFGPVTFLTAWVGILSVLGTLSYPRALALSNSRAKRRAVFWLCLVLVGATTCLVTVATVLLARPIARLYGEPAFAHCIHFLPLLFFASSLGTLLTMALTSEREFRLLAHRTVLNRAGTSGIQLLLGMTLFWNSAFGLVIGLLLGSAASATYGTRAVSRSLFCHDWWDFRWNRIRAVARRYHRLPKIYLPSQLVSHAGLNAPILILGVYYPLHVLGLYALAYRILKLPSHLFSHAASQVYYVEASSLIARGDSAARPTLMLLKLLLRVTALPVMLLLLMGAPLFSIAFGPQWREAGIYAQILAPWVMITVVGSPFMSLLSAHQRFGEAFMYTSSLFLFRTLSVALGGLFFSVRLTLAFYTLVNLVGWAIIFLNVFRLSQVSRRTAIWLIVRHYLVACAAVMPGAVLYWGLGLHVVGIGVVLVGALTYCGFGIVRWVHVR